MSRPFTTPSIFTAETPLPTQLYRKPTKIEKDRVKRPRASKPKVKSGCITCKARRVKCDEKKPECERCQRFGRKCDGYTPEPTPRPTTVVPIQPRLPPPIFRSPNITIHESEEERRYFQYFCDHTAVELAGYNEPTFWTNLIVQEAHVLVPVRYAAIAIGALNKSLATASGCEGKVVDLQTVDQKHHQFAVTHYIKAIQALNHHISVSNGPQLRTALIACILFACFETFEGSYLASQQQINEGLKLLRSYYSGTPGSQGLLATANASVTLNQFSNGNTALEGNNRLDGVTTQFEDHLKLDKGGKFIPERQVDVPKWEDRSALSVYATQPDTLLSTFNQKALYSRENLEHSSIFSNKPLDPSTTKIHDHQPQDLNGYSSGRSSSEPAPTNDVQVSRDLPITSYITNDYGYTGEAQQLPWAPQPEGIRRLSSTISNSSTSSTDSLPSTRIQTVNASPQTFHHNLPHHSRAPTPPILYNDIPIEDIIIQTFVRLNGKCFLSGIMPESLPLAWDIRKVFHLPIPKRFSSFTDAHRYWDFLGDRIHFFCRQTIFYRNHPSQERDDSSIINTYKSLITSLTDFGTAFQPILDAAIEANCNIVNPAAIVLSMYHKVTHVVLLAVASGSEMVYDSFLPTFQNVVRTASLLTSRYNTSNLPRNRRFSFDLGFVPPLHVVATKCRDAVLRREAINLLTTHPRVEGMWDSLLVSRIDQWVMNIEEKGSPFGWEEQHLCPTPHTTHEGTNLPAATFPRIDVHETIDQTFNYPSPPQAHTRIFKSGSPFYDGSPEPPVASRRDDLRHGDSACSLSTSEESRRCRNDGEVSNLYSATRSRHHSSAGVVTPNASASTLDPTFSSDLIYTRPKRHSTGTTEHCQSKESGVSSLSRLAAVASANLLGAGVTEPNIVRMKGTKRMSFEDDDSTTRNGTKNIPPPIAQSRSNSRSKVHVSLFENVRKGSNSSGTHHTDWNFTTESESPRPSKSRASSRSHASHTIKDNTPASWTVPESSRIQIRILDWHVSDRYVRVSGQRAVAKEDGTREILETVISW